MKAIRTFLIALASVISAFVITGIALLVTTPLYIDTDNASQVSHFIANQHMLGIVTLCFYTTIALTSYGLKKIWKTETTEYPSEPGCLRQAIYAGLTGFLVANIVYGVFTLFYLLPTFPGMDSSFQALSKWQDGFALRDTVTGIAWFVGIGIYFWRRN